MMLELVKDFVFKFPNGKNKVKKLNKENLQDEPPATRFLRVANAASKRRWLKGDNDNARRRHSQLAALACA